MLNIFIAQSQNREHGYGKEAVNLILKFAFNKVNLNKVYLRTSERFKKAIVLYKKIGFIKEGILREHYYTNGVYENKIIYSILKKEFSKNEQ
jgi:RimJ/RimL family protein N-acetyltransferase